MSNKKNKSKKYPKEYPFSTLLGMAKKLKKYNISFYTGGVNLSQWSELSDAERKKALSKYWYLRWSFRNPKTGKLERQKNFKGGVNRLKTKTERENLLKSYKSNLKELFNLGYSPYEMLTNEFLLQTVDEQQVDYSVKKAFDYAVAVKSKTVDKKTVKDYESHINKFQQILSPNSDDEGVWIYQNAWFNLGTFDKGMVTDYALN